MTYGFYCENESGFVQVDGTYDNFAVFASGTVQCGFTGGDTYEVAFPAGTPADFIIFAKPTSESGVVRFTYGTQLVQSGSDPTFFFTQVYGQTGTFTVDWVIAVRSKDSSTASNPDVGFGINVYKDDGELAYTSNNQAFRCSLATFLDYYNDSSSFTGVPLASMAGVYTNMNGKSIVGRVQISSNQSAMYSIFAIFDYTNSEIGEEPLPLFVLPFGAGTVFGGGRKTSIWGTFK
mgnify:CR=1 FL=1|tara:strand:- start:544 stop:1245 length:702 start_codon:yes stop_codon:yes gene_type:complete